MLALLKIAAVFAIVTGLLRLKAPLWVSFLAGSLSSALLFGMGVAGALKAVAAAVAAADTLMFVLVVGLVLTLSLTLRTGAQIERITETLRLFMPNRRFLAAALPAIVGLLPMPGGALFSAPMVEAVCGPDAAARAKITINHWFRHIWEYTWPMYPGLIAAVDIMGVPMRTAVIQMGSLTLVSVAAGIVFLLPGIPLGQEPAAAGSRERLRNGGLFLFEMSPFLVVIAAHVAVGLPLVAALAAGIGWSALVTLARRKASATALLKAVFVNRSFYGFLLMAAGVKVFAAVLQASGALAGLGEFFSSSSIPAIETVMVLPFIAGMVSGITVVFVTTSFPVLLAVPEVAADPVPYLVLAYASGFVGTLLSPMHVCFALGCGYFKDRMWRSALTLLPPSAVVLAAAIGLFALMRNWAL